MAAFALKFPGAVGEVVQRLVDMGFSPEIAHWAASTAEGASIEERVSNAFNMLS